MILLQYPFLPSRAHLQGTLKLFVTCFPLLTSTILFGKISQGLLLSDGSHSYGLVSSLSPYMILSTLAHTDWYLGPSFFSLSSALKNRKARPVLQYLPLISKSSYSQGILPASLSSKLAEFQPKDFPYSCEYIGRHCLLSLPSLLMGDSLTSAYQQ